MEIQKWQMLQIELLNLLVREMLDNKHPSHTSRIHENIVSKLNELKSEILGPQ